MIKPEIPPNERDRLQALRALRTLDTSPEERFDRITSLATRVLHVPKAYISLVDDHREWLKSQIGMRSQQNPRDMSFCGHVILGNRPLVLPDVTADPRFMDNPLANGPDGIRAYAGVPLTSDGGYNVGALCGADIGIALSVPKDVPKRCPKPVIRQPTPTTKPIKNGPEILDFRPVLGSLAALANRRLRQIPTQIA